MAGFGLCRHSIEIIVFERLSANLPSFAQNGCLFTRFSNDNSNLRMQIALIKNRPKLVPAFLPSAAAA